MSAKKSSIKFEQPKEFKFSKANLKKIDEIIAKYPKGKERSAIMPLLDLAQRQHDNWIPEVAMQEIARILDVPDIYVYEVATFYTMYNLEPVGKHFVQFCTTTPCWLRGSSDLVKVAEEELGIKLGESTKDAEFTMIDLECLGACVNAPVVQINDDYYEDLTPETFRDMLQDLKAGKKLKAGSQIGRCGSCAQAGPTSLEKFAKKAGVDMASDEA